MKRKADINDKELKEKERLVLNYITETLKEKGYPPAVRDICAAVGIKSSSNAQKHIKALERKGYITKDPSKSRTIKILDSGLDIEKCDDVMALPLVGTVAAGIPILAEEHLEEYCAIPYDRRLANKSTFILNVHGESMINAGIRPGDKLIVEQTDVAENGEIVIALVEDSATVKRFYREDGYYRLQPENDTMDPIIVENVQILGKVIGLLRALA